MKKYFSLLILVILIIFTPRVTSADFGPKTSLDIYVKNAPQGLYYLDLLVNYENDMNAECDPDGYNKDLYRILWEYNDNGYRAIITHQKDWIKGARGELTGEIEDSYTHHSFLQVPSEFKIIIVSIDGDIRVSDIYQKAKFSDEIFLDYETMEITPAGESIIGDWLLQFLYTFSATLLIEGVILLLFGFKLKYNWKPFLFVNLSTQIILIVSLGLIILFRGVFAYIFWFGFIEVAIIILESIVYKKLLSREKQGGRVAYAITANVISLLFTFFYLLNIS